MKTISHLQISILDASIAAVLKNVDLQCLAGRRLFITGGTGFFGLWLLSVLRALDKLGVSVDVCVLSRDPESFLCRYPQFREQSWLGFIKGNVNNFQITERKFDLILHAATETSLTAQADPVGMFGDIVEGTRQVLRFAQLCCAQRVLLISSGAVYGPQPPNLSHLPDDSQLACDPLLTSSAYGEGKRVMEMMGALMHHETGLEYLSARCFAFCGPGLPLDGHFAIGNFVRDALFCEQITVQGDGSPIRSYLYGADLAVWLLKILANGQNGQSYNVGSEEGLSILELAQKVRDMVAPEKNVHVQQDIEISKHRNMYVPGTMRARELGCDTWTSLEVAIKLYAEYWQSA